MKINLEEINQEDFIISERGDYYLILPRPSKWKWEESELHLRSLMTRKDGTIVSSGFPKFFNYGEYLPHKELVDESIKNEQVLYTTKFDGSLIIRDVIDNKVHIRTRGSHELGIFEDTVINLIKEKYPILLDSNTGQGHSLLMEYTSPTNQIVIKYNNSELRILGAVDLSNLKQWVSIYDLVLLSNVYGVPRVPNEDLNNKNINEIISDISKREEGEGIVLRTESGILCKMKSEKYLMLHRLKSEMNGETLRRLMWICFINGGNLNNVLLDAGFDYELNNQYIEEINNNIQQLSYLSLTLSSLKNRMIKDNILGWTGESNRKEQIEYIRNNTTKDLFSLGIALLDKKEQDWLGATFIGIGMQAFKNFKKEVGI